MVRTRFAPSPTGLDAHIGTAYSALINLVFARKNNGHFVFRLEDTDRGRFVPEFEENFKNSMGWLKISWDEGPDVGGPYAPYRQSERLSFYKEEAIRLVESGHAYFCFCTKDRLENLRRGQEAEGRPTMYDGLCKSSDPKESRERYRIGEPGVVRLNVPDVGQTRFTDAVRGEVVFENSLIDDQVLLKSDGFPTYHLAVVVDDHLMKISHIIRAEEWLSSTPKHVLLYRSFGWEVPVLAHIPLLRNPDKSKLSKRKNPVWVGWYKDQGFLPEALINYLALQAWSHPEGKEIFSFEEFIEKFTLERISKTAPAFDLKKLEWLNGEYIRKTQNPKLKTQIYEFLGGKYPEDKIERIVPIVKERIKKLSEFEPLAGFLFTDEIAYEDGLEFNHDFLRSSLAVLTGLERWEGVSIESALRKLAGELKVKPGELFTSIRNAIAGSKVTPPLFGSLEILGKEKTLKRIKAVS